MSAAHSAARKRYWANLTPEKRAARMEKMVDAASDAKRNLATTAQGLRQSGLVRIAIGLDPETFEVIRQRAVRNNVSFAEETRTLIEWGLEADD